MQESPCPVPGTICNRVVVHTCKPSAWEIEVEGSEIQSLPQLHSELEADLDCMVSLSQNKTGAEGLGSDCLRGPVEGMCNPLLRESQDLKNLSLIGMSINHLT